MRHAAVAIVAKAPTAGRVKTRLCPPLSGDEAAALARAFLLDKIDQLRALRGIAPVIAYTPDDAGAEFARMAPGFTLIAQRGHDLGARVHGCLAELLDDGAPAALAIDSDTPTLPTAYLQEAVDRLATGSVDLALGPTEDGGYYLIGMREPQPALFDAVPWSTSAVLAETLRRAEAKRLRIARLPPWFDVDTPADLARLRAALTAAGPARPSHTARFFATSLRG